MACRPSSSDANENRKWEENVALETEISSQFSHLIRVLSWFVELAVDSCWFVMHETKRLRPFISVLAVAGVLRSSRKATSKTNTQNYFSPTWRAAIKGRKKLRESNEIGNVFHPRTLKSHNTAQHRLTRRNFSSFIVLVFITHLSFSREPVVSMTRGFVPITCINICNRQTTNQTQVCVSELSKRRSESWWEKAINFRIEWLICPNHLLTDFH